MHMHKSSNRRKPRIAILVDNPYRDLPGLVLVAWHLCQNGATCYLIPMNLRGKEVWTLAPDFVLLNHFRTVYDKFVANMMAVGIFVGVLDTEGSIYSPVPTTATTDNTPANNSSQARQEIMPAMEEYAISMTRDSALRHNVSCFCAWTPAFAEYARQAGWYYPEQITVTGTPRMDFYASQWHHAARRMSSYVDAYPEPIILINSNFTIANSLFKSPEEEIEMMVNRFSYNREFVETWKKTQETALEKLASLTNRLAEHFPGVTFIYRPGAFPGGYLYLSSAPVRGRRDIPEAFKTPPQPSPGEKRDCRRLASQEQGTHSLGKLHSYRVMPGRRACFRSWLDSCSPARTRR